MKKIAFAPALRVPTSTKNAFVLDGSVAASWFFINERDPYAIKVRESLPKAEAVVPSLWALEVTNAMLIGERKGRTAIHDIMEFIGLLDSFRITVDEESWSNAFGNILVLAHSFRLTTYDAAYLELALRRGLPLATLDNELKKAAKAAGVKLFKP